MLNCDHADEPSSESELLLDPEDEPETDEPDDDADDVVVDVTDADALAVRCVPTAIPPARATVAPTLSAPAASRLRRAACRRFERGLLGLVITTRIGDRPDRSIGGTEKIAKNGIGTAALLRV